MLLPIQYLPTQMCPLSRFLSSTDYFTILDLYVNEITKFVLVCYWVSPTYYVRVIQFVFQNILSCPYFIKKIQIYWAIERIVQWTHTYSHPDFILLSFCYTICLSIHFFRCISKLQTSPPCVLFCFNMHIFPLIYSWFLKSSVDDCVNKICVYFWEKKWKTNEIWVLEFRTPCCNIS
jgi:hypothetical protein